MNSSRVAACALRNEQAVRAHGPGRPMYFYQEHSKIKVKEKGISYKQQKKKER